MKTETEQIAKPYIRELSLRSFKSFKTKTNIKLRPGLNCVVGANGSGKSNILDSLCFVLGRLGTKSLRADNYTELIFRKKGDKLVGDADVSFTINNKSRVFPVDSDIIEITRKIKKNGQAQYKLNRKNATRAQVLEFLSHVKLNPDGHNIVLQGDISRFADMTALEKRKVVEEIAGIGVYEEKKNKALSSLEKIDAKLREAQIILTEKDAYLKGLESEKKEAEKWKELSDELQGTKAALVKLRWDRGLKKLESAEKEIEALEEELRNFNERIGFEKSEKDNLKNKHEKLEIEIGKSGGDEQLALQKGLEELRIDVEKTKNLIQSSKNEINRIGERQSQLRENLEKIENKIEESEKEKEDLESELNDILKKEGGSSTKIPKDVKELKTHFDKIETKIQKLTENKSQTLEELQKTRSEIEIANYKLESLAQDIEKINKLIAKNENLANDKNAYKTLISQINSLATKDSKLALELGALRKDLIKKEETLARMQIQAKSSNVILLQDRAIKEILDLKINGVLGTVSQLGKADNKFAIALQVAAGGRMKNVVVEDSKTAISCLDILKRNKSGIATFLPLSKLKVPVISAEVKTSIKKQKGVLGFAYELINCDTKYKMLFQHVFRDTLVVKDVSTAQNLGIGKRRMVTLDGDIFEVSGAITGGYRKKGYGIEFEKSISNNKLDEIASEVLDIRSKIKKLEKDREDLEKEILTARTEKAELEGKIESIKDIGGGSLDSIHSNIKKFENKKSDLLSDEKDIREDLEKTEKDIKDLMDERSTTRAKLDSMQFGIENEKIGALSQRKIDIGSRLAAVEATLNNALLPEKENILKVIKGLDKEKNSFEKQIEKETKNLENKNKLLKTKTQEDKTFRGKLKQLFDDKISIDKQIRRKEEKIIMLEQDIHKKEHERNIVAINKAKIESEVAACEEEFKDFENVTLAEITGVDPAKKRIAVIEDKLEKFGSVNLKALEVYESVKEDHDKLVWKVEKLGFEKDDVLKVINEIEDKKKEEFLETFNTINEKFSNIYEKINHKTTAEMGLDNTKDPLSGGVVINVKDKKGKRVPISSLSGGEKVLVALGFIFAIQEFDPAPFYLLDEIDAALDKVNSEKVAKLLKEYSTRAQILIISHNDAMISVADQIYGISMNKEGESAIVSLKV